MQAAGLRPRGAPAPSAVAAGFVAAKGPLLPSMQKVNRPEHRSWAGYRNRFRLGE